MDHDLLVSADLIVRDLRTGIRSLVDDLGVPEPDQRWLSTGGGRDCDVLFGQVAADLHAAPTRIELLEPTKADPGYPVDQLYFVPEAAQRQGNRPIRTHATVIGCPDLDEVSNLMDRAGVRYQVNPPSESLPLPRLFAGFDGPAASEYLPGEDCGLWLEFVATPMVLPPPRAAPPIAAGNIRRIAARGYLVDSLDEAVARLRNCFGLVPSRRDHVAADGCDRAVYAFAHEASARLELLAPVGDGDAAGFAAEWGGGPLSIVLEVDSLEPVVHRLCARDVPHAVHEKGLGRPGPVVRAWPGGGLAGAVIDFAEGEAR